MDVLYKIKQELQKAIVGQNELIDSLLIALVSDGHILVEGVPGLAKTTAINALSKTIGIDFKRVQFTPDLLPSDLIGAEVYNPKSGEFYIKKGPIFTNLLLADEINRAPSKVQSALLEVMQERQVTISNDTFKLQEPFVVMATQNPIEQEGTYSLPEAILDRFMLKVVVRYNTLDEEVEIINKVIKKEFSTINNIIDINDLTQIKTKLETIHMDEALKKYIVKIVYATRTPSEFGLDDIKEYINFGASPRASINLYKASCAYALMRGNDYVTPLDISFVAPLVLRHRIILNYKAKANNIDEDEIIKKIIQTIPMP
jgi:MoxR-like ATPase